MSKTFISTTSNRVYINYLKRGLITVAEWHRLENQNFFNKAYHAGALKVTGITEHAAYCSCCYEKQTPGMAKFIYTRGIARTVQFCVTCLGKVMSPAPGGATEESSS